MTKKTILMALFCITFFSLFAQNKHTISGRIKDAETGEDLIGATVMVSKDYTKGTISNSYGYYSMTLNQGDYVLEFSYMGYQTFRKTIALNENMQLDIELEENSMELNEVEITAESADRNVTKNEMSITKISKKDIESIPVLFGEKDILKVVQLTPGVKSAGEGNSGFYVRGGGADQNLILLDEAPVYNASHLMGFFSVFNSDIIKDATLYKGGIPAKYGGRGSSVLDIKMNDGNSKKLGVSGGIGLISSKLMIEAPIVKNKGSFVVSARRTYADLFLKLAKNKELKNNKLYFYDLTAKANYQVSKRDRIYLSAYLGRDKLGMGSSFGFDWGNKTLTLRWNHIFGEKLFSNTSFIYSDYSYKINMTEGVQKFTLTSLIRDYNLKQDFTYYWNDKNTLQFGANVIYHKFLPGDFKEGGQKTLTISNKHAIESAIYLENNYTATERLSINYGLRISHFNYVGPSTKYNFDDNGTLISKDTTIKKWQSIQQYTGFEPRLNIRYQLNEISSLKASYNRVSQYMHLLSNSTSGQPTDAWIPSSNNVKPLIVNQYAIGYFRNFLSNSLEFSAEAYYKTFDNQIDYKDGANLFLNETVESQLVYGKGYAYGLELLLKKTHGRLTGWIGYTYSRAFKKIPQINLGSSYPAKQDRIHDISIVAMYKLSDRVKLAANWVYYTGNAVTFPSGKYQIDDDVVPYYTERNGYRMPNYHRLDIGVTLEGKKYKESIDPKTGESIQVKKRVFSSWNFSLYNAYGRQNAYSITFRPNESDPTKTEAVQTSLFRFVPSISYNFKF